MVNNFDSNRFGFLNLNPTDKSGKKNGQNQPELAKISMKMSKICPKMSKISPKMFKSVQKCTKLS